MKLFNFIRKLLRNFREPLQGEETWAWLIGDHQDIIDPEKFYSKIQITTPYIYEFTEAEKLSVLRLYDYTYLTQLNSENIAQMSG